MDIAFQVHLAGFEQSKFFDLNQDKEIDELRLQFISNYSIDTINDMKIDEYISGKNNKSTFCNRIETE